MLQVPGVIVIKGGRGGRASGVLRGEISWKLMNIDTG